MQMRDACSKSTILWKSITTCRALEGQLRKDGPPYIIHPAAVALASSFSDGWLPRRTHDVGGYKNNGGGTARRTGPVPRWLKSELRQNVVVEEARLYIESCDGPRAPRYRSTKYIMRARFGGLYRRSRGVEALTAARLNGLRSLCLQGSRSPGSTR